MSDHLPECKALDPMPEATRMFYSTSRQWFREHGCICDRLRACEKRVADDIWGAIREGSQYKSGFEGGLDAALEAVERVSTLFEPLGPALAAIDALRGVS